ncbi:glycosyltransferase family 4 protein [Massilia forsythiae]|uniref:Glycosyltransferase family 4 protein n=1 Tax=Massilia forsythiae TaxID=2728020 RepID=A0A7Z2ZUW5_9BURK|nr:glycosyltransferase family 4 protein [Massilia forsythiae]
MTIVNIVRDPLPPGRADLFTLFGKELPRHGIATELVGQGGLGEGGGVAARWPAGGMHVAGSLGHPLASVCAPLWDLVGLLRALQALRAAGGRRSGGRHPGGRHPGCIQVRDKIAGGLLGRVAAALLGVPFLYWMSFPIVEGFAVRRDDVGLRRHDVRGRLAWACHAGRAWASRLVFYRMVLPGARHVFVQSDAMADWLAARGIERARMTAVPMGVDLDLFDRAALAPAVDARLDGRRVLVYLGRIARSRRSGFLLDVVQELRAAMPDALLVIAGDAPSGDEMTWMRGEIAARGLERHVLLTGWLPQRAALGYALRAEVGLSPIPRGELFDVSSPTKLVEYMALGIPSVANDIPDQRQVIEQSGAGLCVPMEAGAFAAACLRLLGDRALAQRFARQGRDYVERRRSYASLGREVARVYRTVLGAHA